ncbi:MAG: hypothetical protein DSY76_04190 [Bacteroidetes bacterium]|nr:MAG: hypothetical protein DSY76_04190 [Bacteroidota bacterium]
MNTDDLKEELIGIKEELRGIEKLLSKIQLLEERLESSNKWHNDGRKVLHRRMDAYAKIFLWFGTTIFTGMAGVIWALVNKVLGI